MNKRETGLSPEELKLYQEGKIYISWRDDNDDVCEMYENLKKEKEKYKQEISRQEERMELYSFLIYIFCYFIAPFLLIGLFIFIGVYLF